MATTSADPATQDPTPDTADSDAQSTGDEPDHGPKQPDKNLMQLQPQVPPAPVESEDALQYAEVAPTTMAVEAALDTARNARDLSAIDWQAVFEINSLLHGFHIREEHEDVVRARRNAFVLKKSAHSPDTRPYFQVEDGSSIQVQETKNDFQRSLAQNAFSQKCIESSLSAGDFGIMAGISGKRDRVKSTNNQARTSDRHQE